MYRSEGSIAFCETVSAVTQYSFFKELSTLTYANGPIGSSRVVSSIEFNKDGDFFAVGGVTNKKWRKRGRKGWRERERERWMEKEGGMEKEREGWMEGERGRKSTHPVLTYMAAALGFHFLPQPSLKKLKALPAT
uniref:Uncharacterized protein n=1 Tax=Amphimedon queenslandica TaxID=400682 RepID=A0A1X7U9C2_AMPQE